VDYRTISSTDADELSRKLIDESKRGVWKVVGVVKDGVLFRAFLEGTAFPEPKADPTLSEREQIQQDELDRMTGDKDKQDETGWSA
jgi:hypothetical protein